MYAHSTVMYSLYLRERIIRLAKSLNGNQLVKALREEGFRVSRSGVYYVLKRVVHCLTTHEVDGLKYSQKEFIS